MNNQFNQIKLGLPIDPNHIQFNDDSFSDFQPNVHTSPDDFSLELNFKSIDVSRLEIHPDNFSAELPY